uniref:Putative kunitz-type protease inhibitor n=1 Tax=Amblyomma triste TaxID=251400 RepID=A0A023GAI5_AMBTT
MRSFFWQLLYFSIVTADIAYAANNDECDSDWKVSDKATEGYYYDKTLHRCLHTKASYGNVFSTEEICNWKCRSRTDCLKPVDRSAGNACGKPDLMYYFDKDTCQCVLFVHKPCKDNGNSFPTLRECVVTCLGWHCINPPRDDEDLCSGNYTAYHYDQRTGTCVKRRFPCNREGSRFKTIGECQRSCLLKRPQAPNA